MDPKDRLIVALDVSSQEEMERLTKLLAPHVGYFKVGLEALTSIGIPRAVECVTWYAGSPFYDGKFMDIPNTVAGATRGVGKLGAKMFNIHCTGGRKMMIEARVAVDVMDPPKPLLLGVTILTSLKYDDFVDMGFFPRLVFPEGKEKRLQELVVSLAKLGQQCGLDGVIASPQEAPDIRQACGQDFKIVTPGIRPEWAQLNDQERVMTPFEAIKAGVDYIVVGRPITGHKDPVEATRMIVEEIRLAMGAE
ncbi:orotidine 5'-phosphate decarboxylase [Candidatus Giovannonibacteria bacterium RIFCSPLOWO2_02_FULL_43_11b]|uniref:Orotidine 5'-phosphate decarboxylase n=1 Tax=Candidatus Giovannonibacteria bacterium RIFCSPHIGHO2_12_FULL_43_15 TaxID=1798341 RepID=A0A1F5WP97_9BACT|nr:MAG: orotidine 5'-phosphate decarboxylase [Candidatus Giovannonibacteria bacterium RIFCSPHIGHO2_01_FULL_43_100]OGF66702.1 MAG: orotidine 5'-phosphate decarboxylase [Candidatus Giovannonibacteria bacterium RIFCSPHIGHO2_02_FULL_43_32]OGF77478.1 MAG: orotidine 5'-phosphate decarboxylase [Candidatus Giovannonibacteria bacterium RIFCSPHIGHO2_12_FULL_43_15]OGF78849.1 MAG: orotidine 5'-phosphate decarboxylase [Candidatus Giovannonibacteria bacterium RIFCSPLOWO2_01_FULL_43_60]OGF89054.1 MAG: orotidi